MQIKCKNAMIAGTLKKQFLRRMGKRYREIEQ
jgi:hypothetical protein